MENIKEMDFKELEKKFSNMIWKEVNKYKKTVLLDKEDLYQWGLMGLWKAQENFDPSKNIKFSTYAHYYIFGWIRNNVRRQEEFLNKDERDIIKEYKDDSSNRLTPKEVNVLLYSKGVVSLDYPLESKKNKNTKITVKEMLSDNKTTLDYVISKENIKELFSVLNNEEKEVVELRFIKGYKNKEIQKILNISHTTLWKRLKNAKKKMVEVIA